MKTKQIQTAAASWAGWRGKLVRQSTCFFSQNTPLHSKKKSSRTASFRNVGIRKASRKTPGPFITAKSCFISARDLSSYFSCPIEGKIKQKQRGSSFAILLAVFQKEACLLKKLHLPSTVPKEDVGRAAEEKVKT